MQVGSLTHMLPLEIRQYIFKSQELPGWCPAEKAEQLCELVLEHRPDVVVETGIFGGRSLIPLAAACKYLSNGIVWGIDPWEVDASIEGTHKPVDFEWWSKLNHEDIYQSFVRGTLELNLGKHCRWLRMKSELVLRLFNDQSIGLFHQDSNHSEEVSCRELDQWMPKIKPGGIWVLDDVNWETNQMAYKRLIKISKQVLFDNGQWVVCQMA